MLDQTQNLLPDSLVSYQTLGLETTKCESRTGATIHPSLDTSPDLQQLFWSIGGIPEQDDFPQTGQGTSNK
jgi:hypothetical protein